jgi:hypothetical protein
MANDTNIYHFEFDKDFWIKVEKAATRIVIIAIALQCDTLEGVLNAF